jgi:hypothetical protein
VPLLVSTLDSPAWRSLSHGAKALYVSLKRRVPHGRNKAYISYRHAEAELRSSQHKISEWFGELQHYGFIVLATLGSLGVDGKGKSPHWRLTELGVIPKATPDGLPEPPTRDFLKWDGSPFIKPKRASKKQNPVSHGGYSGASYGGYTRNPKCIPRGRHRERRKCIPRGRHNYYHS